MQTLQNSSFRENYFKTKGEQKHTQQVNKVIVIQISTWLTRQISKDGVQLYTHEVTQNATCFSGLLTGGRLQCEYGITIS